jgi:hypothetical protein
MPLSADSISTRDATSGNGRTTYSLEVKAINHPCDIDEQRSLRKPVSDADSPTGSELPDAIEHVLLVAIQPPLRHELLRVINKLGVGGDVGVVNHKICAFWEEVPLELQVLSQLMLRRPNEDPPPSEYLLDAGVNVRC